MHKIGSIFFILEAKFMRFPRASKAQYIVKPTFTMKMGTELIIEKQLVLIYLLGDRLVHIVIIKGRNSDR
jgi:hypothetical protein